MCNGSGTELTIAVHVQAVGGAVDARKYSVLTIENSHFNAMVASQGGAVNVDASQLILHNTVFLRTRTTSRDTIYENAGGAIHAFGLANFGANQTLMINITKAKFIHTEAEVGTFVLAYFKCAIKKCTSPPVLLKILRTTNLHLK